MRLLRHLGTPQLIPTSVTAISILLACLCIYLALQPPWLGVVLEPRDQGLVAVEVADDGPAAGLIEKGQQLYSLQTSSAPPLELTPDSVIEEPDMLPQYSIYNRFMAQQHAIFHALNKPAVQLKTDDGLVSISPTDRPLFSLPFVFWFQILCGFIATLTGSMVLAFRPNLASTRCYALTGFSFLLITFSAAIYSSRELALDGDTFRLLSVVNHFGAMLFAGGFVSLLWLYPARLGRLTVVYAILLFYLAIWILDTLQWLPDTDWGIRLPVIVGLSVSLLFAVIQWRLSHRQPLERAALKWFLFSLYTGGIIFVTAIFVTVWLGLPPPLSQGYAFGVVLTMYLGIAVGITRYRLFNLERWWFRVWLWFFAGLAVIATDMMFVYALQLTQPLALGMALVLTSWLYFPVRQWLFMRLVPGGKKRLDSMFPQLLHIGLTASTPEILQRDWRKLLQDTFEPLQITDVDSDIEQVQMVQDGLALEIPGLDQLPALILTYPFTGRRLFTPEDRNLAQGLWQMAHRAVSDRIRYENAVQEERTRIHRDLHDDVGAKLLSLSYRSKDRHNIELARSALQDLRDVVSRSSCENISLQDALADWRIETSERLEDADIILGWQQDDELPEQTLIPQQTMNIGRILRESVSNIIRHSNARKVSIKVELLEQNIHITVENDGDECEPADWLEGRGMQNMNTRAALLGGQLQWSSRDNGGSRIAWWFPLLPGNT